jgi:hypothetical protein
MSKRNYVPSIVSSNYGKEIARYLNDKGQLCAVFDDGTTLFQTVDNLEWRVRSRIRKGVPLEEWRKAKLDKIRAMEPWRLEIRELPDFEQVQHWVMDSVCETTTGDDIEPDGIGPDGAPSWLVALCLI